MRCAATLAALALLGLAAPAQAACRFPAAPAVLAEQGDPHAPGGRLLRMWEMADAPVWRSQADPAGYGAFRAKARRHVGDTDPVRLLAQAPSAGNRLVAREAGAWIRPATCLEKLLQQAQDARLDTFETPTEFAAFVLLSPDGGRLRVYAYTRNEDGIGRMSPLTEPVARDHAAGWTVLAGLHNHNFHPGQPSLNGVLAPSDPDARFNLAFSREVGMGEAWITNGLHTARIPASAFARLAPSTP